MKKNIKTVASVTSVIVATACVLGCGPLPKLNVGGILDSIGQIGGTDTSDEDNNNTESNSNVGYYTGGRDGSDGGENFGDDKEASEPGEVQADWTGFYLTESGYEKRGYATVVAEDGIIKIHTNFNGTEKDYELTESNYDTVTYDYGTMEYARAVVEQSDDYSEIFSYCNDYGERYIEYESTNYLTNLYEYVYMPLLDTTWHEAPEGYVDEDEYGYLSDIDISGLNFTPITDNYVLLYNSHAWMYVDGDEFELEEYEVASFDDNNHLVAWTKQYICEDEEQAKRIVEYNMDNVWDNTKYIREGSTVYCYVDRKTYRDFNKGNYSFSLDTWYVDCHYAYGYIYDDYLTYSYMSKPFTKKDFSVTEDDMVYWVMMGDAYHTCTETKDVKVCIGMDSYMTEFFVEDYSEDYENQMNYGQGFVRVNGKTLTSISYYSNEYDNKNQVFVKECVCDNESCTVTEYCYNVKDWDDVEVTLDNYKSIEPVRTLTHTFDMTRESIR